jgi:hypothetical protein
VRPGEHGEADRRRILVQSISRMRPEAPDKKKQARMRADEYASLPKYKVRRLIHTI